MLTSTVLAFSLVSQTIRRIRKPQYNPPREQIQCWWFIRIEPRPTCPRFNHSTISKGYSRFHSRVVMIPVNLHILVGLDYFSRHRRQEHSTYQATYVHTHHISNTVMIPSAQRSHLGPRIRSNTLQGSLATYKAFCERCGDPGISKS